MSPVHEFRGAVRAVMDVRVAEPRGMLAAVRAVLAQADEALLCVAFANQAGVELVAPLLRDRPVRLLATTVFGQTTTAALGRAADLGAEVRVLNLPSGTYHPKLYLARSRGSVTALVGSANLTGGLIRNVEVGTLLTGAAEEEALARLRALAEGWWAHPSAEPFAAEAFAPTVDLLLPDLWRLLQRAVPAGTVVRTLSRGHPNRVAELTREAVWIETDRSAASGRGPEPVPAWMLNVAWEHLTAHGSLTNAYLLANDGLNVKRSSAVCALLATLPVVEVRRSRPIELVLRQGGQALAAEDGAEYLGEG